MVATGAVSEPARRSPRRVVWVQSLWRGARLGTTARYKLPARVRAGVETFRAAAQRRLVDPAFLRDSARLAESVAEILLAYARHPVEHEDLLAAGDAVLGAGA
jgi:hypothetical protein